MSNSTQKEQPLYYDIGIIPETTALAERIILPFPTINYFLNGIILDRVTLLIASTNAGKTCFASQIIISAIKQGYKTFAFFGEDGGAEARDRLYMQYTEFNKENCKYLKYYQKIDGKPTNAGEYILNHDKFVDAFNFFNHQVFIYNNNLPASKEKLIESLEKSRLENDWKFCILDNCEMFDLDSENENKAMKEILIALRQYAISKHIAMFIVSHIRKVERGLIRYDITDAKGTSSLTNISKNIMSLIRTDTLNENSNEYIRYEKLLLDKYGYVLKECDAVCEVLKTKGRDNSLIGLKFNHISNTYYEATCYKQKENKYSSEDKSEDMQNKDKTIESKKMEQLKSSLIPLSVEEAGYLPF